MPDELIAEIVDIIQEKSALVVQKRDGTTWRYKYIREEISEELEGTLIRRRDEGWAPIAFGTFQPIGEKKKIMSLRGIGL